MKIMPILYRISEDENGSTAIEYGLIASLIVIASIGAFDAIANENNGLWAVVTNKVVTAIGEG